MPTVQKDRYGWVREALLEAGKFQQDLAKAWGIGPAPVSRWIKTGDPALTPTRAKILAAMINMSREELLSLIETDTAPKKSSLTRAVAAREVGVAAAPGGIMGAVKELDEAAARAQALLPPGLKVVYSIEKE